MPDQLPVLDISLPSKDVATHLVQAVSKYGFVYIKNHGLSLPPADIDAMFAMVSIL
jgi:isopenicillin N synthase-like dioxygenase